MQITASIVAFARSLVRTREPVGMVNGFTVSTPLEEGLLDAFASLEGPDRGLSLAEVGWRDAAGDEGTIYIVDREYEAFGSQVAGDLADRAPIRLMLNQDGEEGVRHAFTPDEAEARGWELIALAHLARQHGEG
jgi:hypothetical protein